MSIYQTIKGSIRSATSHILDTMWPERIESRQKTASQVFERDMGIMDRYIHYINHEEGYIDRAILQNAQEYIERHAKSRLDYIERNGSEEEVRRFNEKLGELESKINTDIDRFC